MKRPAFQFYPADWRKETGLFLCSISARGLWIDMICLMHLSALYGHLMDDSGASITMKDLAKLVGESESNVKRWVAELEAKSIFSRTNEGVIFSRRMVRDEELRNIRAAGGEAGKEHGAKGAEHGKKGGRPRKETGDKKPPLQPHPSSSSSTSLKPSPIPPKGAKRESAIALKTFLADCKAKGEKPIPDDDGVFDYAEKAGIPSDFLWLHWKEFIDRYCAPDAKRYKAWRTVFRKSVRGNWFRLWFVSGDGSYALTTVGIQAQNTHKEGKAA